MVSANQGFLIREIKVKGVLFSHTFGQDLVCIF